MKKPLLSLLIISFAIIFIFGVYGDGRKHVQIFNKNDPCCFSGNGYETYEFVVKDKMLQLGKGNFQILIDDTHNEHKISVYTLKLIYESIS